MDRSSFLQTPSIKTAIIMDSKRLCTEVAGDLVPGTKLHISMLGKWILQQILLYLF